MKVYTQGVWCTPRLLYVLQNKVWPSIGRWNTGQKRKKAFPPIKLHQTRNPHDSCCWEAAYSFVVFWCWRQRKGSGSFRSTSFFTSNWTVWLSLGKKSSISVHGKSKFVLIYQPDSTAVKPATSFRPASLLIISILCKRMTQPKTVMHSPAWSTLN